MAAAWRRQNEDTDLRMPLLKMETLEQTTLYYPQDAMHNQKCIWISKSEYVEQHKPPETANAKKISDKIFSRNAFEFWLLHPPIPVKKLIHKIESYIGSQFRNA